MRWPPARACVAAWLALALAAAPLAAVAADGWQQYAAGQYVAAVATWTEAAARGDPSAQFGLGLAYDLGNGVGQDQARACAYYQAAGTGGVAAASFDYAVMLDGGRCGKRDAAAAADWYGRAAAAGHARAMYDLAQLYEQGDGVPRNAQAASSWYRLAADAGLTAGKDHAAALAGHAQGGQGSLIAATPVSPSDVSLADRGLAVPFTWSAPAEPEPVTFFLEVYALSSTGSTEVFAQFVDVPAVQAVLRPGPADYAWRVLTVAPAGRSYAASPWKRFAMARLGD